MNQGNFLQKKNNASESKSFGQQANNVTPVEASEISMDRRKALVPRSKSYIYAMLTADEDKEKNVEKIVKKMPLNNKLIGILSICKIPGCIIHSIDKEGNILEHYETENDIPDALQEGYQVFLQHPGCFSVEVYTLYYCVVYENGSVKFYERNVG